MFPQRPHSCITALVFSGLTVFVLVQATAVLAHEGHGKEIGAFDLDAPRKISPETAAHIGLETAEVDFGTIEDVLDLLGIVRAAPDRHWTISNRTAGKVLAVHVQVGDRVRKGDLLIDIDSPDYQKLVLELVRAKGRVKQLAVESDNAEATASLAEEELKRSESATDGVVPLNELFQKRTAAIRARGEARLRSVDLDIAREEARILTNQVEVLRRSLDTLLSQADIANQTARSTDPHPHDLLIRLLAPADGVVVQRHAQPGQWAAAGDALLAIVDYSVVQIEGELPESLIARVTSRESDTVRIRTPADREFLGNGKIKFISPMLDEIKRTAHILIEAANPTGTLRGSMFVDLTIVLREEEETVVVPASAVVNDGPVHFVFLKQGDVYQKQDITPGLSDDRFVEILAGLAPGDVVVSQGAYSLTQLRPKATALASAVPTPDAATKP